MAEDTDILIVGAGAAGVAAAIEAEQSGANVKLIDQLSYLGGAARVSGGGCIAVGTQLQASMGIQDTVEQAVSDWLGCNGVDDEPWARYYLSRSLKEVYMWGEDRGVLWEKLKSPEEGNSVSRRHYPFNAGEGLMDSLIEGVKGRIKWMTETMCRGLIMDDGRVVGINTSNSSGEEEIRAKAVILTTGGFCSNLDLIQEYAPHLREYRIMEGSGEGSKGLGHVMLKEMDAIFPHLGEMCLYCYATPDYRDPTGKRGLVFRQIHENIWINAMGRRFHNEVEYGADKGTKAFMSQNPPKVWSILDERMARRAEVVDPYYREGGKVFAERVKELFDNSPHIIRAPTIEALAKKIEVPPDNLSETVRDYNSYFETQPAEDLEFGKPLEGLLPLTSPPFYAIHFLLLARKSLGGVGTNFHCQVMHKNQKPIPGLYAAGEIASIGGCHPGYLGHILGQCLLSGRMAGAWASNEAGYGEGFNL